MPVTINGNGAISGLVITTADLQDSSVTTAKIADGAVVTADLANASVTIAKISATGTPSSTTYLRGDGSWQTISTTPTTAQVLSAYAGAVSNDVGSYFFARSRSTPDTLTVNSTVAGSNLRKSDTVGNAVSAGLSGTWRFLGYAENDNLANGLYLRIS